METHFVADRICPNYFAIWCSGCALCHFQQETCDDGDDDDDDDDIMMNNSYYYHHCHNHYFYQYLFIITDEGYSDEWVSLRSVQENQVLLQYATILLRSATEYTSFPFG